MPNSEEVAGYRLYYGNSSRDYYLNDYIDVPATINPDTNRIHGTIPNLNEQEDYFFAVTAVSADYLESDFSTEIIYLPPILTIASPADGTFSTEGDLITFTASAVDTEGNDLSSYIQWQSDINGEIGTGATCPSDMLATGTHAITASVTDTAGQLHEQTILLTIDDPVNLVSFSAANISSYDSSQDGDGTVSVEDNGATLTMTGTRWIKTDEVYEITPDTILEFDFRSTVEGEIQAIGFDEDGDITNAKRVFQVFGSQAWSNAIQVTPNYSTTELGTWLHVSIAVGQFYTGSNMRLVLVNDNDAAPATGSGSFRNIRIKRSFLDFANEVVSSYTPYQDRTGPVTVEDNGTTLAVQGNRWLRTGRSFTITRETVLEFDFMSTAEGEIHGIGFDEDDDITNGQRVFQIFGNQDPAWKEAIQPLHQYKSTDLGTWVHFTLAVGEYYTGSTMRLVFVNDDDRDPATGAGRFKNVQVYSAASKILGSTPEADYTGTVSETYTNLNETIHEGQDHISTWSWASPAPHLVANTIVVKTDLSSLPANAYITEARLYLYQTAAMGAAEYRNSIHKITGLNPDITQVSGVNAAGNTPWTPVTAGTTYNNIPMGLADIAVPEDTILLDQTSGYRSWKITTMVQDWIDNPDSNYGLLIQGEQTAEETGRTFASSEHLDATQRPFVVIRYSAGL